MFFFFFFFFFSNLRGGGDFKLLADFEDFNLLFSKGDGDEVLNRRRRACNDATSTKAAANILLERIITHTHARARAKERAARRVSNKSVFLLSRSEKKNEEEGIPFF